MSQLNSVWVFSDNPERYAELFGGAQQWGQQVYAIVQNTDQAQAVMPYGPKCLYVLAQNDALQRTENYAESIAALLINTPLCCCWPRRNVVKRWQHG